MVSRTWRHATTHSLHSINVHLQVFPFCLIACLINCHVPFHCCSIRWRSLDMLTCYNMLQNYHYSVCLSVCPSVVILQKTLVTYGWAMHPKGHVPKFFESTYLTKFVFKFATSMMSGLIISKSLSFCRNYIWQWPEFYNSFTNIFCSNFAIKWSF